MPYIKQEKRDEIYLKDRDTEFNTLWIANIECAGDLNFAISIMIKDYINRKGLNYQHINDIIGALEGAKAEFQRRVVAPYEDKKIIENGDLK